jgi:hypothetical protein
VNSALFLNCAKHIRRMHLESAAFMFHMNAVT